MTTRRLITWITFLGIFAMAARLSMDPDTWWHLRAGEWILTHRAVPQVDLFSYTRQGAAWQYPGWLVQAPMAWIYRVLGPGGLNLWTAGMVTLAFTFLWRALSGGPFLKAFVLVLAAAAAGVYWAARPYLVTFLMAAIFLWVFEAFRWRSTPRTRRRLWLLPALMAIWANSHGGFAVGFLLWGVYWTHELLAELRLRVKAAWRPGAGDPHRYLLQALIRDRPGPDLVRLLAVGALMLVAVCLNPSGPALLLYPFKTVGIGALQAYIQEWQSPDFHSLAVQPFAWLLLLTLGVVGASRRRLALTDFLLAAGFAYLGLLAGRNIALFALAAPLPLSRHADELLAAWRRSLGFRPAGALPLRRALSIANTALLALILLAVLAKLSLVTPRAANEQAWAGSLPVRAVETIRAEHPPGRLFNAYNWGGYLLWSLPEYPVFIDGRTDLYDDPIINQWLTVVRGDPGWEAVLDRWDVRLVLLEPGMPVVRLLEGAGWRQWYVDELAVVYAR